jgi:hypothetical protein
MLGNDTNNFSLKKILKNPDRYYIIHYSCQSLYDDNEGLSPRIASIVVMHLSTQQVVSFSTHSIAEQLSITRQDCANRADDIEKKLLSDFSEFMRDRRDKIWLHWNMKNLTYGFEHIEHRFRTLHKSDMPTLPVERRVNIDDILSIKYGDNYVSKPRMQKLMELNGGLRRNFRSGTEEVELFKQHQFSQMHASTASKVEFFRDVIVSAKKGNLKVESNSIFITLDRIYESRFAKIAGTFVAAIGLIGTVIGFIK